MLIQKDIYFDTEGAAGDGEGVRGASQLSPIIMLYFELNYHLGVELNHHHVTKSLRGDLVADAETRFEFRPAPVLVVRGSRDGRRRRSNLSGKCWQELLTQGTVTSTMRKAEHLAGCARRGAGAGCSAIKYQSLWEQR